MTTFASVAKKDAVPIPARPRAGDRCLRAYLNALSVTLALLVFGVLRESCATTISSALSVWYLESIPSAVFDSLIVTLPMWPEGIEKLAEPSVSTFFLRLAAACTATAVAV